MLVVLLGLDWFDDKGHDKSRRSFCGVRRKELLVRLNTLAFFWHLLLAFTLLTTLAFLKDTEDDSLREWGIFLGGSGYFLLLLLAYYKHKGREVQMFPLVFLLALLPLLIGLVCLSSYVQENRKVFPIQLSTTYNHPPVIPAPFDSEIIDFSLFPPGSNSTPPCKVGVYAPEEFVDWFQCLRKSDWKKTIAANPDFIRAPNGRLFPKGNWVPFEPFETTIYLWWGVVFFCLVTALFHLILLWGGYAHTGRDDHFEWRRCAVPYWKWIQQGRQPLRWAEYSITASVMIVLILSINRVTDIYQIAYSFILMELINSFGAGIDYTNSPVICLWFWVCSGTAFFWQWVLIFNSYFQTIKPYVERRENFTADLLWKQLFDFITPLNWVILLSFSSFAVVNLIHQCYRFRGCLDRSLRPKEEVTGETRTRLMFKAEVAYIFLSFLSKGLLVIIVSAAASSQQ